MKPCPVQPNFAAAFVKLGKPCCSLKTRNGKIAEIVKKSLSFQQGAVINESKRRLCLLRVASGSVTAFTSREAHHVAPLGCTVTALTLFIYSVDAGGVKDKKDTPVKDKKDTPPKDKKKYEVPKDAIEGKVKSVDLKEPSFTITLSTGKDRMFVVDAKTEFWGPRGGDRGTGPAGLKDDCMEKGYVIHVVASKEGKTAVDVHLPARKNGRRIPRRTKTRTRRIRSKNNLTQQGRPSKLACGFALWRARNRKRGSHFFASNTSRNSIRMFAHERRSALALYAMPFMPFSSAPGTVKL